MGEWLSYRLSDLLMFTPEVYFRLFERYNAAFWPGQLVALLVAIWMIVVTRDTGPRQSRWVAGVTGAVWLFIAWAFFLRFYSEIFLAAPWFAVGFALQGLLLIAAGSLARLRVSPSSFSISVNRRVRSSRILRVCSSSTSICLRANSAAACVITLML